MEVIGQCLYPILWPKWNGPQIVDHDCLFAVVDADGRLCPAEAWSSRCWPVLSLVFSVTHDWPPACGLSPLGAQRDCAPARPSVGEAVRVAGRVTALEPDLVHPQPPEVVAVREESGVGRQTACGDIGVELGHPCPDAVWVKDLVPRCVKRVGHIDPSAVTADLHH